MRSHFSNSLRKNLIVNKVLKFSSNRRFKKKILHVNKRSGTEILSVAHSL